MVHCLKTLPLYFERVWSLEKQFEVRKDDRGFQTGDKLILFEWDKEHEYTGRKIECTIKYILKGFEGLTNGYVALGIEVNNCYS